MDNIAWVQKKVIEDIFQQLVFLNLQKNLDFLYEFLKSFIRNSWNDVSIDFDKKYSGSSSYQLWFILKVLWHLDF